MGKKNRLGEDPIYDIRQLPVRKNLLLGLQHAFAMFGATVLVPILTGLDVATTLLMAGLGTLLFHLCTKGKVPAFLGSSFAFIGGYNAVAPLTDGVADPVRLQYACGGVAVAGLVYLGLAAFIKTFGIRKVMRFFPPVVTGPIIISIGLILAPTAIKNCQNDWLLAIIAIATIVICSIWGKGMVKIVPIILGIVISYVIALMLKRVDFTLINQVQFPHNIIGMPINFNNMAKFDLSAIITIVPISLATIMEHIGDMSAISATTGKNYIAEPGLHRTLLGDGLATALSSLFGGPANTTYGENTGVLVLTKVYDPKVTRIAAVMAIILSFIPVISASIRSIPVAIIGGVSLILYGMISAIGIRNVVENKVDFTKSRNLIVAAIILVSALGFNAVGGIHIPIGNTVINLSGIAIAALAGIILNAILPGKDYEFTVEEPKDTGVNFSTIDTTKEGKHKE